MEIIGYKRADFTTKDGAEIKGITVYYSDPINNGGKGLKADKFFLSDNKLVNMGIDIDELVGKKVVIYYNKWQKPESISVVE